MYYHSVEFGYLVDAIREVMGIDIRQLVMDAISSAHREFAIRHLENRLMSHYSSQLEDDTLVITRDDVEWYELKGTRLSLDLIPTSDLFAGRPADILVVVSVVGPSDQVIEFQFIKQTPGGMYISVDIHMRERANSPVVIAESDTAPDIPISDNIYYAFLGVPGLLGVLNREEV